MKPIETALKPTNAYIDSFTRNTVEGWWELEMGLPLSWVYDENKKIGCEVVFENDLGKLIKVYPKTRGIDIDDLIAFVEVVIKTNARIAEKEKEFTDKMEEMKGVLEKEAKKFYQELDELKESSFKKAGTEFANTLTEVPKKRGRPKGSTKKKVETVTEETTIVEPTKE